MDFKDIKVGQHYVVSGERVRYIRFKTDTYVVAELHDLKYPTTYGSEYDFKRWKEYTLPVTSYVFVYKNGDRWVSISHINKIEVMGFRQRRINEGDLCCEIQEVQFKIDQP